MDRARNGRARVSFVSSEAPAPNLRTVPPCEPAALAAILLPIALAAPAEAAPVAVRYVEGSSHGFVVLRSYRGALLANGQLIQTVRGTRVESRLFFHFADGSSTTRR